MNYSKYSRARKSFDFDMVFPNTYEKIIKLLKAMNEASVKPELECFDTGHTQGIWPLLDMGVRNGRNNELTDVLFGDGDERMPPDSPLNQQDLDLITAWIDMGAPGL